MQNEECRVESESRELEGRLKTEDERRETREREQRMRGENERLKTKDERQKAIFNFEFSIFNYPLHFRIFVRSVGETPS